VLGVPLRRHLPAARGACGSASSAGGGARAAGWGGLRGPDAGVFAASKHCHFALRPLLAIQQALAAAACTHPACSLSPGSRGQERVPAKPRAAASAALCGAASVD